MGTSRLPFSAASQSRRSQWRGFSATVSASAPAPLRNSSVITCFRSDSDDRARATTKAVKYSRANFLTPVPHAPSFEALNAALEERCRAARMNAPAATSRRSVRGSLRIERSCVLCPRHRSSPATSARPNLLDSARALSRERLQAQKTHCAKWHAEPSMHSGTQSELPSR
jgi:hypothetical protein